MDDTMTPIEVRLTDRFPEPEFSVLQRRIFAELEQDSDVMEPATRGQAAATAPGLQHSPMVRWGAYENNTLVGWSYGWMERDNVFYMANSGVLPTHRRRGIYTALINAIVRHATIAGAWAIRSRHSVVNNPVLIAKLREGFTISGMSQSARMGTLVELTLHLSREREVVYRRRVLPYRS
jgi:hypothetical protein